MTTLRPSPTPRPELLGASGTAVPEGAAVTDLRAPASSDVSVAEGVRSRVVLDTSVLIGDPSCFGAFEDVDVVIPLTVI